MNLHRAAMALMAIVAVAGSEAQAQSVQRPPLRILSLDQCADQFALALAGPDDVLFLSPRADDPDSYLREQASSHRRLRPSLEAALVARPDVVVRYWGGDPRLMRALEAQGARVMQIEEAKDFHGVRDNMKVAGEVLEAPSRAAALIADMDRRLASGSDTPLLPAFYLTPGGFTAGEGTLVEAMMRAAGLSSLAPPGFGAMSLERLILAPPARFVIAFFEQVRADWRGPGRHPALRRLAAQTPVAQVHGSVVGCPAWFVGVGVDQMRQAARP